jgi:hypothetical protein
LGRLSEGSARQHGASTAAVFGAGVNVRIRFKSFAGAPGGILEKRLGRFLANQ